MDKKVIEEAAVQFAEYVTKIVPQFDEDKNITYYFSGSVAMDLIPSAVSFKRQYVDKNGRTLASGNDIQMTENAKQLFVEGVRPISFDVDTVAINDSVFDNPKGLDLGSVRRECDKTQILCPNWKDCGGTMYFDALEGDREINSHFVVVLTLANGKEIAITDPVYLLMHKLNELFVLDRIEKKGLMDERNQKKRQKDIVDFSCLFNGLSELGLLPEDMVEFLSDFCVNNHNRLTESMGQEQYQTIQSIHNSIKTSITEDYKAECAKFFDGIYKYNQQQVENGFTRS